MNTAPVDPPELLTIAQIAAATGLGAARIQNWEKRWGWPVAMRDGHGRRLYKASLIPHLREAARRSDSGRSLRDDIVDGVPVWLADQPRPRLAVYDLTACEQLPPPRTIEGQRLRASLLQALNEQNEAAVVALLAHLPTIHPEDRHPAVIGVLLAIGHPLAASFTPAPAPVVDMAASVPPASAAEAGGDQPVPAAAASPGPDAEIAVVDAGRQVTEVVPDAAPTSSGPPAPARPRRHQVSDETLAEWQATLARQAAQRHREQAAIAARKTRAESFRQLRQALKRLERSGGDPAVQRLAEDDLAARVHQAPERIRTVLAAVLANLQTRRPRHRVG